MRPVLGVHRHRYADIPGNHDHFDGWDEESLVAFLRNPPPAWNPNLFRVPGIFRATPYENLPPPWLSSGGSIKLELFCTDSNTGLAASRANRRAKGRISDVEFAQLEDKLRNSNHADIDGVTRVRAIVCHHAFTKNPQAGWFIKASPLSRGSRKRLLNLAAKYRVAAVLTGHTHMVNFHRWNVNAIRYGEILQRRCAVYEIRCPTTSQGLSNALVHGFWIHHLFRPNSKAEVIWRPELYLLAAQRMHPWNVKDSEDLELP
jgi:hypothetical protein